MTTLSSEGSSKSTSNAPVISNLSLRLLTSMMVLPVTLFLIFLGGWLFALFVAALGALGALEFYVFARGRQMQGSALIGLPMVFGVVLAFYTRVDALWIGTFILGIALTFLLEILRHPRELRRTTWQVGTTLAGVIYVGLPSAFLVAIRGISPSSDGLMWLLLICFATWGTDTFAYVGGRFFGRTPLAPVLSPKKTLEGAIVGVICGIVIAYVTLLAWDRVSSIHLVLISFAPLMATWGDLFESALKRFFHVKDSHIAGFNIFPGHGGVLDRIDSLLWVTALFYVVLALTGTFAS